MLWYDCSNMTILKNIPNIIIGITDNYIYNENIAIFNLENNIIKSGKIKDKYDFKLMHKSLINEKLLKISNHNGSIVIIENYFKKNINDFKNKIEILEKMLDVNFLIIISTLNNYFSKPFTGIYKLLEKLFKIKNIKINKSNSIYIGSNAGRVKTLYYNKNDYSDIDRAFANNININFYVPENFFFENSLNYKFFWSNSKNQIRSLLKPYIKICSSFKNDTYPILKKFISSNPHNKFLILIIGNFCSGKSDLSNNIKSLYEHDFKHKIKILSFNNNDSFSDLFNLYYNSNNNLILILNIIILNLKSRKLLYNDLKKYNINLIIITNDIHKNICQYLNYVQIESCKNNLNLIYPKHKFDLYSNFIIDDLKHNLLNGIKYIYINNKVLLNNKKEFFLRF